jgi:hypothetical protein
MEYLICLQLLHHYEVTCTTRRRGFECCGQEQQNLVSPRCGCVLCFSGVLNVSLTCGPLEHGFFEILKYLGEKLRLSQTRPGLVMNIHHSLKHHMWLTVACHCSGNRSRHILSVQDEPEGFTPLHWACK